MTFYISNQIYIKFKKKKISNLLHVLIQTRIYFSNVRTIFSYASINILLKKNFIKKKFSHLNCNTIHRTIPQYLQSKSQKKKYINHNCPLIVSKNERKKGKKKNKFPGLLNHPQSRALHPYQSFEFTEWRQ